MLQVQLQKCFSDPLRIIYPSSLAEWIFGKGAWSFSPPPQRYAMWNTDLVILMTCIWSYHPASSLPAKLQLHFQCSCCAMKLEHAWIHNVPIIESKVHWHPWCTYDVCFSLQIPKWTSLAALWASFLAGAISDSCESSLLLRFFPPCYLSLECTRNSLLWLGSPAVQAFHFDVQLHESDIALGDRKASCSCCANHLSSGVAAWTGRKRVCWVSTFHVWALFQREMELHISTTQQDKSERNTSICLNSAFGWIGHDVTHLQLLVQRWAWGTHGNMEQPTSATSKQMQAILREPTSLLH